MVFKALFNQSGAFCFQTRAQHKQFLLFALRSLFKAFSARRLPAAKSTAKQTWFECNAENRLNVLFIASGTVCRLNLLSWLHNLDESGLDRNLDCCRKMFLVTDVINILTFFSLYDIRTALKKFHLLHRNASKICIEEFNFHKSASSSAFINQWRFLSLLTFSTASGAKLWLMFIIRMNSFLFCCKSFVNKDRKCADFIKAFPAFSRHFEVSDISI